MPIWAAALGAAVWVLCVGSFATAQNTNTAPAAVETAQSNANTGDALVPEFRDDAELLPGQTVSGEVVEGEPRSYVVSIKAGQVFQVSCTTASRGIELDLSDEHGKPLARMMGRPDCVMTYVSDIDIKARLTIGFRDFDGMYSIRREADHAATDLDRERVRVEALYANVLEKLTAADLGPAIADLRAVIAGADKVGDRVMADTARNLLRQFTVEKRKRDERRALLARAEALNASGTKALDAGQRAKGERELKAALALYQKAGLEFDLQADTMTKLGMTAPLPDTEAEKPFASSAVHVYKVVLAKGDVIHLTIKVPDDGDVDIVIKRPGRPRIEDASYVIYGSRSVAFMAPDEGEYLVVARNAGQRTSYKLHGKAPYLNNDEKEDAASTLHARGVDASTRGEYELASLYHSHAVKLREQLPESEYLGLSLEWLGNDLDHMRRYDDAARYYERSLAVYHTLDLREREWNVAGHLGVAYANGKRVDKALDHQHKYLEAVRTAGEAVWEGRMLNCVGDIYRAAQQRSRAAEYYGQALAVFRKADDAVRQIWTHRRLGDAYSDSSENTAALEHYRAALAIADRTGYEDERVRPLEGIASALLGLGRYDEATAINEEVLRIAERNGERRRQGVALANIGLNYYYRGNYEKAFDFDQKALTIFREVNDRREIATMLNNLGAIYRTIGSYKKAIVLLNEALQIALDTHDEGDEATARSNLGGSYLGLGELDKAIEHLDKALAIDRKLNDGEGIAAVLGRYGTALREKGNIEQSATLHREALDLSRSLKARQYEARALKDLGWDHIALKKPELAADFFEKAVAAFREIKAQDGEAQSLHGLMIAWREMGRRSLAVFYGKQSIELLQAIRKQIVTFEQAAQEDFVKDTENVYRSLAQLLAASGRLGEAEQVTTLLKQEEYFDFLKRDPRETGADGRSPYTDDETAARTEYASKADEITRLGRRLEELKLKRPRTDQEEQELVLVQRDLDEAARRFHEFLRTLVDRLPDTRAGGQQQLRVEDSEAFMETVGELGRLTGQPGRVAAIYTLVGEEELTLIVVTSTTRRWVTVPISADKLNILVEEFRAALRNKNVDTRPVGAEMYKAVFEPIEQFIVPLTHRSAEDRTEEAITLMWSLDGTLRYVPIAALWDPVRKKYLAERFRNTVFTFKSKDKLTGSPDGKWTALGLGVTEGRTESGVEFGSLPQVKTELEIIADESRPDPTKPLRGKVLEDRAFKLATMSEQLLKVRRPVVHVASHFNFAPTNDDDSFLLLGEGKWTVTEMRKSGQIFSGVQLLTLSACNTAMGRRDASGKEVDGFGTFAQDKGAQSVIATLWSVADDSTAQLMRRFYEIRSREPVPLKIEALRTAQLSLLYGGYSADDGARTRDAVPVFPAGARKLPPFNRDPRAPYAHPYYWAPFVLFGNWR